MMIPENNIPVDRLTVLDPEHNKFCVHRGNRIGTRKCESCGNKGAAIIAYTCTLYGECTLIPWKYGQGEMVCETCPDKSKG